MSRLLLPAALLLAWPTTAPAQFLPPTTPPSGYSYGGFGGGFRRPLPPGSALPLTLTPGFNMGGGPLGGFVRPGYAGPGFPFSGVWGGFGYGGFFPYYGYPTPLFATPVPVPVPVRLPAPAAQPEPVIVLANEFPAVLTMEFPAAAEVWVNGKKGEGEATTEWTLTSPVLKAGGSYTFEVKARWKTGGTTYEAERSVAVAGGNRSRVLVIAGTPVRE